LRLRGGSLELMATGKVGYGPYEIALSPDGKLAAVTNMAADSVSLLRAETLEETARIAVGHLPSELAFSSDGRLFVANSGSSSVSVIRGGKVVETVEVSLKPGLKPGSTPSAIAVNPAGTLLFAANAGNNSVTVVDISHPQRSSVEGFIPTGWYPSALAVSANGSQTGIIAGILLRDFELRHGFLRYSE
jgi:YVTN family beta-propeller protein